MAKHHQSTQLLVPLPVAELLPHRPPMLMVEEIVAMDDEREAAALRLTIRSGNPFLDADGALDPAAFLEIIAQAAAAQHGANRRRDGMPAEDGMLLGVRDFCVTGAARTGESLVVEVRKTGEIERVATVDGSVRRGAALLAVASLTVWHGDLPPSP
jgi:predicted hotdog family 3-hydroxylacyl-ACP dehydratase